MFEKRGSERAVAAAAVRRFLAGRCRKGDERVAALRLDPGEPAAEIRAALGRGEAPLELVGQRVVAAGSRKTRLTGTFDSMIRMIESNSIVSDEIRNSFSSFAFTDTR